MSDGPKRSNKVFDTSARQRSNQNSKQVHVKDFKPEKYLRASYDYFSYLSHWLRKWWGLLNQLLSEAHQNQSKRKLLFHLKNVFNREITVVRYFKIAGSLMFLLVGGKGGVSWVCSCLFVSGEPER